MAGTAAMIRRSLAIAFVLLFISNSAEGNVYVVYTNGATSERSLPICNTPRTACNIIHKRFWLTPLVKRFCKCPDLTECPQEWSTDSDTHTIMLNGRAQMKFCGHVANLPNCTATEKAATIESYNSTSSGLMTNVEVNCYCPNWRYFDRLHTNILQNKERNLVKKEYYRCQPIQACDSGEFCGHITADLYETYYQCSCPKQHICVMNKRRTIHASEALYEGLAYRGICMHYEP